MIGQTTCHGWRLSEEPLSFYCCSFAELVMETAKVVGAPNQVHPRLQGLEALSGRATRARSRRQPLSDGPLEPLDGGGVEPLPTR